MTMPDAGEPRRTPRDDAESEERELAERMAAERATDRSARSEEDDTREEEGWTQPESSAQKSAIRDEEEG
jgi:hypothetical protein